VDSPKITHVSLAAAAKRAKPLQGTAPTWRFEVPRSGRGRIANAVMAGERRDIPQFNRRYATSISTRSVFPESMFPSKVSRYALRSFAVRLAVVYRRDLQDVGQTVQMARDCVKVHSDALHCFVLLIAAPNFRLRIQ
jgi:hypothetical protein